MINMPVPLLIELLQKAMIQMNRIVAESHDTDENLQKGQTMKKDVMIVTDAGRIGMALARRTGSLP